MDMKYIEAWTKNFEESMKKTVNFEDEGILDYKVHIPHPNGMPKVTFMRQKIAKICKERQFVELWDEYKLPDGKKL